MQPVVLVMPGEAGSAGHEWVVPISDGVGGDVAQVGRGRTCRVRSIGLSRHSDVLVPPDENKLWTVHVVRFDEHTVPGRGLRSGWQSCARGVVIRCSSAA